MLLEKSAAISGKCRPTSNSDKKMASTLELLKDSLGNIASGGELYSSGGRQVPLPDKQAIESLIEPIKKGRERGANELPPLGTSEPDEVELKILDAYQEALTDTGARVSETAGTYNSRIQSINLLTQLEEITDGCRAAIETFKTQVLTDENTLKDLYRIVIEKESDYKLFKADNGLRRSAHIPSKMRLQLGWSIVALIFLVESFVNAGFLSEGNQAGLVGAYAQSFSFSFINLFTAYLIGTYSVRAILGIDIVKKRMGLVGTVLLSLFAIFINLALAHYRDASALGVSDQLGMVAMQNLTSQPFTFNDLQSLVLFFIGCAACLVAAIDFFGLDDPYPGYGKVAKARRDAFDNYESEKQGLIDDLDDMRGQEEESIKGTRSHLSNLQNQMANLIEARKALFAQWEEFKSLSVKQCVDMIAAYREANRQSRTRAPKSFSKKVVPVAPELTAYETPVDQERLRLEVAEAREVLKSAQEEFYSEFNQALKIFREVERKDDAPDPDTKV